LNEPIDLPGVDALPRGDHEQLMSAVGADPGCDAFALLAESHRLSGHPDDARRVAEAGLQARPEHLPGRVALGLALLDLGDADAAREVLGWRPTVNHRTALVEAFQAIAARQAA